MKNLKPSCRYCERLTLISEISSINRQFQIFRSFTKHSVSNCSILHTGKTSDDCDLAFPSPSFLLFSSVYPLTKFNCFLKVSRILRRIIFTTSWCHCMSWCDPVYCRVEREAWLRARRKNWNDKSFRLCDERMMKKSAKKYLLVGNYSKKENPYLKWSRKRMTIKQAKTIIKMKL